MASSIAARCGAGAGLVIVVALVAKVLGVQDFPVVARRHRLVGQVDTEWLNKHSRHGVPLIGGTDSISDFLVLDVLDPSAACCSRRHGGYRRCLRRVGWISKGWRLALLCGLAFVGIAAMHNWDLAMDTLSQVLVAVVISICLAMPFGVWAGRSPVVDHTLRPLLDTAQVLPQFVYLVPVLFLFASAAHRG